MILQGQIRMGHCLQMARGPGAGHDLHQPLHPPFLQPLHPCRILAASCFSTPICLQIINKWTDEPTWELEYLQSVALKTTDTWNNLFRHRVNLFQPKGHHQCQRQLASRCFCIYFLLAFQHLTVNTFHCFVNLSQTNVLTAVLTIFLLSHQPFPIALSCSLSFWNFANSRPREPAEFRRENWETSYRKSPLLISFLFTTAKNTHFSNPSCQFPCN